MESEENIDQEEEDEEEEHLHSGMSQGSQQRNQDSSALESKYVPHALKMSDIRRANNKKKNPRTTFHEKSAASPIQEEDSMSPSPSPLKTETTTSPSPNKKKNMNRHFQNDPPLVINITYT